MQGVWFVPSAVQRNWILSTHANVIGKAVMYVSRDTDKVGVATMAGGNLSGVVLKDWLNVC
jgi:hypothetical protein